MGEQYWRDRAEETRVLAERMGDADARETMLRIARGYDRLAARAARAEASATESAPAEPLRKAC
jgi:predicted secreted protein